MRPTDLSYRLSLILVVALLLAATFVRVNDLAHTPPGIGSDITWNFADSLRISRGIPFPAVFGDRSEPLYRFLLAGWGSLTGLKGFSQLFSSVLLGLLTLALTYRAMLTLLVKQPWRRLGALVALGMLAAMMPYVFMNRASYRALLLPIVLLLALNVLLRASRSQRGRYWLVGGFLGAFGVHTYLAGIMMPLWTIGFVGHQLIVAKRGQRIRWRNVLFTALGMTPPLLVWLFLLLTIPHLLTRVDSVSSDSPVIASVGERIQGTLAAFFLTGFPHPLYNTPNTPFLNPALGLLALVGLGVAFWRWRSAEGALLLGGIIAFSLPGTFSREPGHPIRLVGTLPLLSLFAGWGAAWLMTRVVSLLSARYRLPTLKWASVAVLTALFGLSLVGTHLAYHTMFNDPKRYENPAYWLDIPHNYTLAFVEALEQLAQVEQPTYVPLSALNTPAAMFLLQSEAFPNVTTWARYGLTELPKGQIFYPMYYYYHDPAPPDDALQGLLLPDEKTIVILPGKRGAPVISMPAPGEEIIDKHGWVIARVAPIDARPLSLPTLAGGSATVPTVSTGLRLLANEASTQVEPGKPAKALLYWGVTQHQPADIFTVTQFLSLDWNAYGNSDQQVLPYLYPSPMWQPGDVIPDLHIVPLPADLPDGVYRWGTGAYVPPGQTRLPLVTSGDSTSPLENIALWGVARLPLPVTEATLPAAATLVNVRFDDGIELVGYQLVRESEVWTVTLYWRAATPPHGDYTLFVHLIRGETMVAQQDTQPQNGALPTWAWQSGELVTTTHTLALPANSPTPNTLYVGLYSFPSLQRLAITEGSAADNRAILWSDAATK